MNWFKRLFIVESIKRLFKKCEHEYEFVRNIYGDAINWCGGYRSVWRCKKCGKLEYRDHLYHDEHQSSYNLCTELDKLYDECYDKRYKEWQLLRSETLNKIQADMRNLAFNGQCWYDINLFCDEKHNDKNYYEKWLSENKLKYEHKLLNNEKCEELNQYEYHIRWKYNY